MTIPEAKWTPPVPDPEYVESNRHDPLLRLDQFIHRQDEMIRLMKVQIQLTRNLMYSTLAALVFVLTLLAIGHLMR